MTEFGSFLAYVMPPAFLYVLIELVRRRVSKLEKMLQKWEHEGTRAVRDFTKKCEAIDAKQKTQPQPYRSPPPVPDETKPERVFCEGCRFLAKVNSIYEDLVCLASPNGDVSPIDGLQKRFYLARYINDKYNCNLREEGTKVLPPEDARAVDCPPPRPPPKLPDPVGNGRSSL